MYYTTFKQLLDANPCRDRYQRLARRLGGIKHYGKNTPISLLQILDSNGLDDALWAFRAVSITPEFDRFSRLLVCDLAEHVLPSYEAKYPGDTRPRHAIETARRYANGEATAAELAEAEEAIRNAAGEAWDEAADEAGDQAWLAVRTATAVAAWAAVSDAVRVAGAGAAADAAAGVAAAQSYDAAAWAAAAWEECQWQEQHPREKLEKEAKIKNKKQP